MARPVKPAKVLTDKSQTKAEINSRIMIEEKIRGDKVKLIPPKNLTASQKKIFKNIVKYLEASEILSRLDMPLLRQTAITVDRLEYFENRINEDVSLLENPAFMSSKDKYTKDFFRLCNELGLSPQSRAKFANLTAAKAEDDPLLNILEKIGDDS